MSSFTLDPLTCDEWALWRDVDDAYFGCDCPAKKHSEMCHWWTCNITPIFAKTSVEHKYSDTLNEITKAKFSLTKTVFKCSDCGQDSYGEDMIILYRHTGVENVFIPENAIRLVCTRHPIRFRSDQYD